MEGRTYISDVKNEAGKDYLMAGWISRIKDAGKVKFLLLTDRSGTIQITFVSGKVDPKLLEKFGDFGLHDFLTIKGKLPEKVISKEHLELIPDEIAVVSRAERPLPLDVSGNIESELETRLNWRAIELRDPKRMAVLKVQAAIIEGMEQYLNNQGFINAPMPSIMGVASEGGAEVFPVVYFDKSAFLRQDSQLFRQLLMVAGMDRVYEIAPNWRAELSHTPRHMCEFRSCAVELSFIEDEEEVNEVEQRLVQATIKHVVEKCKEELKLLGKTVEVPRMPFPEFRFPEVYGILEKEFGKKIKKGEDLDHEAERMLGKYAKEKYGSDFYFINRFPSKVKPFYVMKVDDEPTYARSVDLEYKGMEISSGGQREHRYEKILAQVKEKGLSKETTEWFTKFFKYGAPTHGGFAIGVERFVMQMLDVPNIFEVPTFARTPERLVP